MRTTTSKSPSADVATRLSSNPGHGPGEAQNPPTTDKPRAEPTREELFEQCKHLALAPSILDEFGAELRRCGTVGKLDNFHILFLAMNTRFSPEPMSAVLKGDATAGKSFTLNSVLKYFPSGAYESLSGMSEKALIYWDVDLRHKMLVIGEYAGLQSESGNAWLRQLLTEDKINYAVPIDEKGGGRATQKLAVEGPTGLLMTTTAAKLHPEDETRMLSLYLDDGPEHTAAVLRAQAMKAAGIERPQPDVTAWQALHRWIDAGPKAVVAPFFDDLAASTDPTNGRMKRDFPKVLQMVNAHALIHQATRERDPVGRIVATLADYAAVHDLMAGLLAEGQAETLDAGVNEVVAAVSVLSTAGPYRSGVPQTAIVEYLGGDETPARINKSTVSRRVKKAVQQGYLTTEPSRPGAGSQLKVGRKRGQVRPILPTPSDLASMSST
jgi:hypothetical protein